MHMRKLILTAAASALAIPALVLAFAMPANATSKSASEVSSARSAPCGTVAPNLENRRVNDAAYTGASRQRTGSSTACTALGSLQPSDDAIYYCWTSGVGGTWTYALRHPHRRPGLDA